MAFIQNLIDRIMYSIAYLFSTTRLQLALIPPIEEFTFDREPFETPQARETRKRETDAPEEEGRMPRETLAELLEHLDKTFETMKLSIDPGSWLDKDTIRGLRRMGVYVPHPWAIYWKRPEDIRIDVSRRLPAIMSISMCQDPNEPKEDDRVNSNTMYAIKYERLPYYVSQLPGVVYQFGCSYKFSNNKNFWIRCYLVVDRKTGEITICDELTSKTHIIPVKRNRKSNGRYVSYVQRQWQEAALVSLDEKYTSEQRKEFVKNMFSAMVEWWMDRDKRWSVGVKLGKDRVVFSVEPENTKTYFADRDKSVKAADGKAKKIIHYVRPHKRIRNGKTISVREHIRGIREFDWGKYHCVVTAPTFHKTRLSSDFDLGTICEDDIETYEEKVVSASQLGAELARIEEMDLRKKAGNRRYLS